MAMDLSTGKGGKKGRPRPEMNVTPLVDVVLVLLIIFMVITPLLSKQFWLHLPTPDRAEAPAPPTDHDAPVVLAVDAAGVIRINKDVVARADLATRLRRVLAARGDRTVFFDADDEAPFDRAVEALDTARGGGAATLVILTTALQR